jgi:hypothetical protein
MAKYIKRGVKRKHSIIQDILPLLERIAKIEGIKKVIPAKISYSSNRRITQPIIKFQRETVSGFKLMAHSKGAIQEIFVIVDETKKKDVEDKLNGIVEKNDNN